MTPKEIAAYQEKADKEFKERDPEGYAKAKKIEKENEGLKKDINGLEKRKEFIQETQNLLEQTKPEVIIDNVATGTNAIIDAIKEANKQVDQDVEKRRKEKNEKQK